MSRILAAHAVVSSLLDPAALLHSFGPWVLLGIAAIVFVESGVLFPFLPGDSLILTAAILAPALGVPLWLIALVAVLAAIAGDQAGYTIGRRLGRRLFRPDARVLRTSRLEEAERFFARYGAAALVLGRFVPVVRTYVPLAAGTAALRYGRFALWNAIGGVVWVLVLTTAGEKLGGIPLVADHIDVLMILVVLVSLVPLGVTALLRWRSTRSAA